MNIPQLKEFNIYDLESYLEFCESLLHWVPTETFDGKNVYYHLCLFYFILGQSPIDRLQTPILPTSKSLYTWLSQWIIRFAKAMGSNLDKPESLTPESLETFRNSPIYHMEDYEEPEGGWKSFNHFFARKIKGRLRPVAGRPGDHSVIVSPADSVFDGCWRIENNSIVYLKHIPWPIRQLLAGSPYKSKFGGGAFTHSFLAPYDYHRLHAPVAGEVLEARVIPGLCYLEVDATTDGDRNARLSMKRALPAARSGPGAPKDPGGATHTGNDILAPNTPGYQFLQARGLIVIKNPDIGLVAVLPIGMCQVSSVVLTVKEGDTLKKGDEISYFQCGGSDCVMLFQRKANVGFTTSLGQHYNVGIQVARAFPDGIPQEGFKPAPKRHKHIKRPESALPNGH
ncbi:phosphatidylserine decarboxylase-domain-containing protein [Cantharellus anzutake]|uniref:phosphatidylserine decarboxylase-domain-containing protein n=1 Tax=Cantharellus anzutake TaxID=1750568 RepID=UPI001905F7B8|nr:phosphatidylserine decarboxylase-domain-containing protein [Cantharellus anzutake]KAF8334007.1 phosphatidylserine decarboxylase-domain-containing protein [Cantharellus anzutake]